MKTVRKCFLAMLSTVSIAVAASSVQAQSLPGSQGPDSPPEASGEQLGSPETPAPVQDANPRSSEFATDQPDNQVRQVGFTERVTSERARPPVVQASQNAPVAESFAAPQNSGQSVLPHVVGAGMLGSNPVGTPTRQMAPNGPPLAYMPAAGATQFPNYGVAPAAYPPPQGYGQPPAGYGPPQFQMQQASAFSNPGMGMPQGPPPGYHQGPPQPQANFAPPQALPPGIGGMAGPAGGPDGQSFCGECGGGGCANCGFGQGFGNGSGFMAGLLGRLLPYAEGGQCAPRWYDVTLDAMYLSREEVSRRVDFTADGPGPNPNIIMSTDDLEFDDQVGLRLNAAVQVLATATAEFTYYGLFSWTTSDTRTDPLGGLFSPMSQFATFPPGGFPQTDNAVFHSIAYSSSIDNFELNFRRRWTAPNCRVQASYLMGVRYFYLLEDFRYFTEGLDTDPVAIGNQAGTMDYNIRARNSLTGFQVGADLWSSIVPGVKVGGEFKAGVFGNYAHQMTVIDVTEPDATYNENKQSNDIAIMSDANMMVIWRVNPNWTIRAGYFLLYVDGVALAPEQFNATAPPNLVNPSTRNVDANDNGSVFYHGGFAGLEWQW